VSSAVQFRAAGIQDVDSLARLFADGLATYREFAPEGWEPNAENEPVVLPRLLADDRVWCLVAEEGGAIVGEVMIMPVELSVRPVTEAGLAHLRNLFVSESYWGTGLARDLHRAAVGAAHARGYSRMRLYTAAGHGRARRFYEREGWVAVGAEFLDEGMGLPLIEYRYELSERARL
jgi:GNAT superfamily N-acetyltransferase